MSDILATLRTTPIIKLTGDKIGLEAGKVVRQMMVERAQAADEIDRLRVFASANDRIGSWLSAALDDPQVCQAMKDDITAWFSAQPKDV